jgi:hypothetical protein
MFTSGGAAAGALHEVGGPARAAAHTAQRKKSNVAGAIGQPPP